MAELSKLGNLRRAERQLQPDWLTHWLMTAWLWFTNWLTDWLTDRLTDPLTSCLLDWLADCLIDPLWLLDWLKDQKRSSFHWVKNRNWRLKNEPFLRDFLQQWSRMACWPQICRWNSNTSIRLKTILKRMLQGHHACQRFATVTNSRTCRTKCSLHLKKCSERHVLTISSRHSAV